MKFIACFLAALVAVNAQGTESPTPTTSGGGTTESPTPTTSGGVTTESPTPTTFDIATIEKKVNDNLAKDLPALNNHYKTLISTKKLDPWSNPLAGTQYPNGIAVNEEITTGINMEATVKVGDVTGLSSGKIKSLTATDLSAATGEASGKIGVDMGWTENIAVGLKSMDVKVEFFNQVLEGGITAGLYMDGLAAKATADVTVKINEDGSYCISQASVENVTSSYTKIVVEDVKFLGGVSVLEDYAKKQMDKIDKVIASQAGVIEEELGKQVKGRVQDFMNDYISAQKCNGGAGTTAEGNDKPISESTKEALDAMGTSASGSIVPNAVVALFIAVCAFIN